MYPIRNTCPRLDQLACDEMIKAVEYKKVYDALFEMKPLKA